MQSILVLDEAEKQTPSRQEPKGKALAGDAK
jgi:hypothetical protein